ncbi:hypothetical protein L484_009696 [Morus notabilis]|uniref:Ribosomal RNA-processing protein 14/surfeit locus protein 6 C-terminal domain-containing protein n=1 Tax=Morus notabilis TaxID=981085 RepID=W9S5T5_9ROSA|nr:hypothetical protein L484_009696 [Morus notabilis]
MKKVKTDTDSTPIVDLKSIIHQHSLFFDKLVELIPANFYLSTGDKDKPWFQGLSKAEKVSAKKETKENIKKARRDRLDPEKSSTTTLDLLKQSFKKEKKDGESDDGETEIQPNLSGLDDDNRLVTWEELRQRLRRRIKEFRATRNTRGFDKANKRNERNDKELSKRNARGTPNQRRKSLNWVHDNPKLLKESIRKEKRRQQKNAQKWKATQKMKAERQQKRSENIAAKKHDKKMRKIAKRERKLMRPGFEGRKEGFVNEGSTA